MNENVINANNSVDLTKIVTKPSENDLKPSEGCKCIVLCKLLSSHPKITDEHIGFACGNNSEIKLGYFKTEISRYLHVAIETMKLNEIADISFELNEKLVFPDQNNVKAFVFLDFKFQIELIEIDFKTIEKVFELSIKELFSLATEHKNEANQMFKSNLFITAFYRYQTAIRYLIIAQQLDKSEHDHEKKEENEESTLNEENKKKIFELKSVLYLNIAACQLKYPHNAHYVITNCTKCLEIDAHNVKALFRRAIGYAEINEVDKAIEDLSEVLKIEAKNKVVEEKLRELENKKREKTDELSNNLKKMFK